MRPSLGVASASERDSVSFWIICLGLTECLASAPQMLCTVQCHTHNQLDRRRQEVSTLLPEDGVEKPWETIGSQVYINSATKPLVAMAEGATNGYRSQPNTDLPPSFSPQAAVRLKLHYTQYMAQSHVTCVLSRTAKASEKREVRSRPVQPPPGRQGAPTRSGDCPHLAAIQDFFLPSRPVKEGARWSWMQLIPAD